MRLTAGERTEWPIKWIDSTQSSQKVKDFDAAKQKYISLLLSESPLIERLGVLAIASGNPSAIQEAKKFNENYTELLKRFKQASGSLWLKPHKSKAYGFQDTSFLERWTIMREMPVCGRMVRMLPSRNRIIYRLTARTMRPSKIRLSES